MLALRMLYAMMVGVAVTGAAALLEEHPALAAKGRWVWTVALLAGLVIPLLRPSLIPRTAPVIDLASAVVPLAGIQVGTGAAPGFDLIAVLARWDRPLAGHGRERRWSFSGSCWVERPDCDGDVTSGARGSWAARRS